MKNIEKSKQLVHKATRKQRHCGLAIEIMNASE